MTLVLAAIALLIASGLASLTLGRGSNRVASVLGAGGAVVSSLLGVIPAIRTLATGEIEGLPRLDWSVPYGSFSVQLDEISALFAIPIFVLTAIAAVYGVGYLADQQGRKSLASHWFFYNLLTASMVMVTLSRNGILFLMSWELMSLASFFLVTFDDESDSVRNAGRTYLIATHIGAAFLFVFFLVLGQEAGSLDFDLIAAAKQPSALRASVLFVLAVIGFGTKAGFMPMHVWLPEAHPAAPSHVSAVMSGVMVKTGVYGLVRAITLLPVPASWWGWLLIGIGAVSGVWGILYALAQHDIKRLLAYSTVENVGIIAIGLGIGLIGMSTQNDLVALMGITGALWHVMNHAMFKGLLFLGAGAIAHATHTRDLNVMGGLLKRMPWLGLSLIIGAVAICGLPPLNGFPGEFLIYLSAYRGEMTLGTESAVMTLAGIGSLALIGGLAVVAFTKVVGIALLGEPRSEAAAHAHAPGRLMTVPIVILALGCIALGLAAGAVIKPVATTASMVASLEFNEARTGVHQSVQMMSKVAAAGFCVFGLLGTLALLRFLLLRNREVTSSGTWGCGYAAPTARMQYTASSYVEPVVSFLGMVLQPKNSIRGARGLFPEPGSVETTTEDLAEHRLYRPMFRVVEWASGRLRWLQQGSVNTYAFYIAATLFVLLVWYLGWSQAS